MSKCWYCQTRKGKRYCAPLENVLCPVCCGKNRLVNIDCNEDCRYLEGAAYQKSKDEEKEYAVLFESVPHGQYDDIFHKEEVALMAADIELFVRNIYMTGSLRITDKNVYESYKKIYQKHFKNEPLEEDKLEILTELLLQLYDVHIEEWRNDMDMSQISQVFLRLMLSIKNMSGGRFGEFGYLNYLKNNFADDRPEDGFIVEDKFGNVIKRRYNED